MKEQFVTYDIALKLKVLGFDEECLARYLVVTEWEKPTGEIRLQISNNCTNTHNALFKAPLWQQAIDWLREKYQLHIYIDFYDTYAFAIKCEKDQYYNRFGSFEMELKTYHEAREQAILKAIELIIKGC